MQKYYSSFLLKKSLNQDWKVVTINILNAVNNTEYKSSVIGVFKDNNRVYITDSDSNTTISYAEKNGCITNIVFSHNNTKINAGFNNGEVTVGKDVYNSLETLKTATVGTCLLKAVLADKKIHSLFKTLEVGGIYSYPKIEQDKFGDETGYSSILAADNGILLGIVNVVEANHTYEVPKITVINKETKYNLLKDKTEHFYTVRDTQSNMVCYFEDISDTDNTVIYVGRDKQISFLYHTKSGELKDTKSGGDWIAYTKVNSFLDKYQSDKIIPVLFTDLSKHIDYCSQYCLNREGVLQRNEAFDLLA